MGYMRKHYPNDEDIQQQLEPNYTIGCKRILGHGDYYPTLALPHVKLHSDKIVSVEENRIISTDGSSPNLDVNAFI